MTSPPRAGGVVVLFVDGVGIGPDDAAVNPFANARLERLTRVLGGATSTTSTRPR